MLEKGTVSKDFETQSLLQLQHSALEELGFKYYVSVLFPTLELVVFCRMLRVLHCSTTKFNVKKGNGGKTFGNAVIASVAAFSIRRTVFQLLCLCSVSNSWIGGILQDVKGIRLFYHQNQCWKRERCQKFWNAVISSVAAFSIKRIVAKFLVTFLSNSEIGGVL